MLQNKENVLKPSQGYFVQTFDWDFGPLQMGLLRLKKKLYYK